jgi:glycosyltransferase involved in cell wall biosynthesis
MIPTFNCADYLRITLQSLLDQAPGPDEMQIEVVDDCSTKDNPEAVVQELGRGRVQFFRQPGNVGAIENFNTCVRRSRGHYVHLLHGDDLVYPGFYSAFEEALTTKEVGIVFCRCFVIDVDGEINTISDRLVSLEIETRDRSVFHFCNPIRTPGVVIRRDVYEGVGGFLSVLIHCADWEMWARATQYCGAFMINKPLAGYRVFALNDTSRLKRTGDDLVDMYRCGQVFSDCVEGFDSRRFNNALADFAFEAANNSKDENRKSAAREILNELIDKLIPGEVRVDRYGFRSKPAKLALNMAAWLELMSWRLKRKIKVLSSG